MDGITDNVNEKSELEKLREEAQALRVEARKLRRALSLSEENLHRAQMVASAKARMAHVQNASLDREGQYFRLVMENSVHIILLFDIDGRFAYVTETFLRRGGIPSFGLIDAKQYSDVLPEVIGAAAAAKFDCMFRSAVSEKHPVSAEIAFSFASGGERDFLVNLSPMVNEGETIGVMALFHDVTDLNSAVAEANRANRAKSDFLANMSHEIRTPMNAIIGMTEMLGRGELPPQETKYVADIKKSSQSLLAIINDILDFSKIEAGKMEIIETDYSMTQLLDNLHSIFRPMFAKKGLQFAFDIAGDFPERVYGDENRLRQVLTNLLSNALKYTNAGTVTFTAAATPHRLRFAVRDTGIGIKEEDASRLFRQFEQLDIRRNRNVVGTGLGLVICRRLCDLMGGSLTLKSRYGKGSTFSVSLPRKAAPQGAADAVPAAPAEFSAPSARVLLVDDIEINLSVASAMLGVFDIVPDCVQSGKEAIGYVREREYDLIFMDQMMPEMDGIEATKLIRLMGGRAETVPIIALTANAIGGVEQMFLKNTFNGYLPKPIEFDALNLCLRKFLPGDIIKE
jgi:PAS domain S-box-containing protein